MGRLHADHSVQEWATARLLPSEPVYLSTTEVCTVLGISRATARLWIEKGVMPAVQVGGKGSAYRIPASWLISICQQGMEYREAQ